MPLEAYARLNMLREKYVLTPTDYLIQQPTDGVIIFGGQQKSVPIERLLRNTDDVQVDLEMAAALWEALLLHYFEGWGENSDLAVMCRVDIPPQGTPPVIVSQNGKAGEIQGMARVMTCAQRLAALIQGTSRESAGLPECFQPTCEWLAHPKQVQAFRVPPTSAYKDSTHLHMGGSSEHIVQNTGIQCLCMKSVYPAPHACLLPTCAP
ncbi:hypothetical protein B0H14DRAFT_3536372 [Mycena olivaceomarginata]|nr:hypothetical protein B0H14DRAFT_3536372 [Mycena olivaceomarginata]